LGLYVPLCSFLTVRQVEAWSDNRSLWQTALEEDPENGFAHNQLSASSALAGDFDEALVHSINAVRFGFDRPDFLFNLCRAYRGLGDLEKELACAREITRGAPEYLPAWTVLLRHDLSRGRLDDVERRLTELRARFGPASELRVTRGALDAAGGDLDGALGHFAAALRGGLQDGETLLALADALAQKGDSRGALLAAHRAILLQGAVWFPDLDPTLDRILNVTENAEDPETRRQTAQTRRLRVALQAGKGLRGERSVEPNE